MENFGNFFGQNVFIASSGVLLIVGTLEKLGYSVAAIDVAKASIPVAVISFIIVVVRNYLLDKKLDAKYKNRRKEVNK